MEVARFVLTYLCSLKSSGTILFSSEPDYTILRSEIYGHHVSIVVNSSCDLAETHIRQQYWSTSHRSSLSPLMWHRISGEELWVDTWKKNQHKCIWSSMLRFSASRERVVAETPLKTCKEIHKYTTQGTLEQVFHESLTADGFRLWHTFSYTSWRPP